MTAASISRSISARIDSRVTAGSVTGRANMAAPSMMDDDQPMMTPPWLTAQ